MTTRNGVYKCAICGNIVTVLTEGQGVLTCCDAPMNLLVENSTDGAHEKHVPMVIGIGDDMEVSVGSVAHPMQEEHYIEWIEVIADGVSYRKFLKPGDTPDAKFSVAAEVITARAYCNLHGLWKA
ncbi:MAG: desulfoferrodoxin [Desulfuromusa sp.]|nr:desulfoferrodoxin [Desulfuromusa sp.]